MCGICGITGTDEQSVIERMTATLAHRGPDDAGVTVFPHLALGHRRLSVLDLSPLGHQPMSNEDGNVWLTFNGEIYNFRELKATLDPARHQFASQTDSEVILHLYEERGAEAFKALNGMFALALYDAARARLWLVRDQLGIKPLYYAEADGKLLFGSEIKALLAADVLTLEVDWQAASDFFSFLYVPAPQTIFRDVRQLPAAHWLEYDLRARRIVRLERYWRVGEAKRQGNPKDLADELRATMTAAVRSQMVSDVPLGAFLSGGIDSNVIVGLLAEHSDRPVKTFTVLFEGAGLDYYDERVEARRVAERFGTEHHELPIDLSHPEEMLDLVECFDQPFGNTTFYLTYLLSKYTREHVTVALSGAGGDELFAGYPRYRAVQLARYLGLIPPALARAALAALARWPDDFTDRRLQRLRALLSGLDGDPATQYLQWVYYLNEERKAQLLKPRGAVQPAQRVLQEHLRGIPTAWEAGNRFSLLDVETFLPDNLLEYSDKTSMAWAL
jgi:asparagine synthase (glutamine-hydrolysing)